MGTTTMNKRSSRNGARLLSSLLLILAAAAPRSVAAQGGYLAVAGQNQTVEILRLTDFTKLAAIDVSPMKYPYLQFLPLSRRLYVFDGSLSGPGTQAVLDLGTCSGGLLRPLNISNPGTLGANGAETKILIGAAYGVAPQAAVYIVDPSTDTVTGTLAVARSGARSIQFDPDRNEWFVWVENNDLRVYSPDLTLLRECDGTAIVYNFSTAVAGGKIYLPYGAHHIEVHDALTCNTLRTLFVFHGGQPSSTVRTRSGDKVYILNTMDFVHEGDPNYLYENVVIAIDTATDAVTTYPLGRELASWANGDADSMVLSADESQAYIAMGKVGSAPNALGVLDLHTGVMQQYPLDILPTRQFGLALIDRLGFQCGDGVVESACGEQCDPPGSTVNGTVCDLNCTTGCGNGIASGTEQCDDGNSSNNDACKSDCTWNVCGDGFVYRGVEQCDHGGANGTPGDACDANCHLPPRTASGQVDAGGTLTTDSEGDGATAAAPVETWVTSPVAGQVTIEEGAPDPTSPSGYAFLGYSVHVTVPAATPDHPIVLVFEIDAALLPAGSSAATVEFSKNGVMVLDCVPDAVGANPDPCVSERQLLANGNLRVRIRSSTASYWGGVAPWHDARVLPRRQVALTIGRNKLTVSKKALVRVRNMDRGVQGKKTPIQLTATNVDCPLGLIADVPDFDVRTPFSQDTIALAPKHTATARLRLVASRFAFPKIDSPRHCTIRLTAASVVVDNVDPTPADNSTTVQVTVTTR